MSNSLATVHADLRCASRERRGEAHLLMVDPHIPAGAKLY